MYISLQYEKEEEVRCYLSLLRFKRTFSLNA